MSTGERILAKTTRVTGAGMFPLSKEASAYSTSHPLNKQKIATTNLPNMAFYLPFGGAVEHTGSGQYFWLCFL